jgi:hypothetical protein
VWKHQCVQVFLSSIVIVLTLGLYRLVLYWKPDWYVWSMCVPSPAATATLVLIRYAYNTHMLPIFQ